MLELNDNKIVILLRLRIMPIWTYAYWICLPTPGRVNKTSSSMGNDRSPGNQHNVWRYHNLGCSKAGNSELETVTGN